MFLKVVSGVFLGILCAAPFIPSGSSSCDMLFWYNAAGLQRNCPSEACALCGKFGDATHKVVGTCKRENGMVDGVPYDRCVCSNGTAKTPDTCFGRIVYDPVTGPRIECLSNPDPACDCDLDRWIYCEQVADFPVAPTQVCQCNGGWEEWDN